MKRIVNFETDSKIFFEVVDNFDNDKPATRERIKDELYAEILIKYLRSFEKFDETYPFEILAKIAEYHWLIYRSNRPDLWRFQECGFYACDFNSDTFAIIRDCEFSGALFCDCQVVGDIAAENFKNCEFLKCIFRDCDFDVDFFKQNQFSGCKIEGKNFL